MNREIKFRGKRKDNGEWVYGDLRHIAGGTLIYHGSHEKPLRHLLTKLVARTYGIVTHGWQHIVLN